MAFTDIGELPLEVEELGTGAVDLVWLAVALFCFLMVAAGWVVLWVLHLALGKVSIFGVHPFDFFYDLATDALKSLVGVMVQRCEALGHWLWALTMTIWRPLYVIGAVMAGLAAQIVGVNQGAQDAVNQAKAQEQADMAAANARMDTLYDQAVATEQQAVATLGLNVLSIQAQLNTRMDDLYNQGRALEQQDVAAANARMGQLYNQAVATEQQATATLNARMDTLYNQSVAGEKADVADLTSKVNTVQAAIPTVALGVVTAATPGIIAKALTQLQPQLDKVNTELNDCLDPLCDTVTPQAKRLGNLGKLLSNLEALGVEALLVALAAECLTNPSAVVEDVTSVVGAVGEPVLTALQDLIGA